MVASAESVAFLHDDGLTGEQRAALERAGDLGWTVKAVPFEDVGADSTNGTTPAGRLTERFDVLWWHADRPIGTAHPLATVAETVDAYLEAGGDLLLTGAGMAAVDALAVETVGPDVVEHDSAGATTGLLWRSLYNDHPVASRFDSLRIPVRDGGEPAVARYETVLPERGEILASTVRGESDVPQQMRVVSWRAGKGTKTGATAGERSAVDGSTAAGTVLGVGAGLVFDGSAAGTFADDRDAVLSGCLRALTGGYDHPSRPHEAVDLAGMREALSGDADRPSYHLTPPANWLNDPNGLIEYGGRYHVFYQYNPGGPFHSTIHWGHAVSDDLVTWTDEPVALSPSPDGPDRHGCWSGCAVDDGATPRILYTGGHGREQLPCLATAGGERLCRWEKHPDNPVIEAPPADLDLLETDHWAAEFRDHTVWREGDTWHQLIGTGLADAGGAVLHYTGETLTDWRYEGPLLVGDWEGAGAVWECPELLDLGGNELLHVSDYESVRYFLGERRNGRFRVERRGTLDHGDFYAPQSLRDGDRWLTWGWLKEARDVSAQWDAGWSGALSLPRELSLGPDGRLRQRPAAELRELREGDLDLPDSLALGAGERDRFDAGSQALELDLEVRLDDAEAVELSVFESPDGSEQTPITYSRDGTLTVDRAAASADDRSFGGTQRMDVTPYDGPLSLRVFLDGSVVELFANERHCLTSRVYPTDAASTRFSLTARDGRATVSSLRGWTMGEAFADGTENWQCSAHR